MKRLVYYITFLASFSVGWFFTNIFASPAVVLASNSVTLSTVNGGNVEYVASRVTQSGLLFPWFFFFVVIITAFFWVGPAYRTIFKKDAAKKE